MVTSKLSIRKTERADIPYLVDWATNHAHTKFFHGYLPKTLSEGNAWFQRSLLDKTREDFVICITDENGVRTPIGILGLVNIDDLNRKAEYYVLIGNEAYLHRGIAFRTSSEMIRNTYFKNYEFLKLYARVDKNNFAGQKMVEKLGFRKEGVMLSDMISSSGTPIDQIYYGLLAENK